MMQTNYLKLYIGPMFSGKTSNLLTEICKYSDVYNVLVVNHVLDKQRHLDSNFENIKTHDNESYPAIMVQTLLELKNNILYNKADVVIIDEGQFFTDLYEFLSMELNNLSQVKTFIVAGLSSDYKMSPIGDIIRLIPLCDEIYKLKSSCTVCNQPASFTKKNYNNHNNNQIQVGNSELFYPVCRLHHRLHNIN